MPMSRKPKIALCLPGGGATGAMFQIGALAALEDGVEGVHAHEFDLYIGTSSGATVAATLAGGRPVDRSYRAFLDPADNYFPLERKHILQMDFAEWRRTIVSAAGAVRHGTASLLSRGPAPNPAQLWEELDRLFDSLPAGLFSLDTYERFLEDFFVRRGVPNNFTMMPRELRIMAHDLDSGEQVEFGKPGFDQVPVTRACIASMAVPPFFSPVRIWDRHYIDAGAAQVAHLDVAVAAGASVIVVVNPMVPVSVGSVPTGHGTRTSVRDKGMMWVTNQAIRIGIHKLMRETCARVSSSGQADILLIEPEATDGILFMHNPASFAARRKILEYAYRTTRAHVAEWFRKGEKALERAGWHLRAAPESTALRPEEGV
jgi:predicted acylesterase/phospholipase RssA